VEQTVEFDLSCVLTLKVVCITTAVTTLVGILTDQSLSFFTSRAMNEQIPLKFRLVFAFVALLIIVIRRRLKQKRKAKAAAAREAEMLSAYLQIHSIVMPADEDDEEVVEVMRGFAAWRDAQLAAEEAANAVPDEVAVDFPGEEGGAEGEGVEMVAMNDVPPQPPVQGLANQLMAAMVAEIAKEAKK